MPNGISRKHTTSVVLRFHLIYSAEEFAIFSDIKNMYILPARFCKTELFKDYSSISLSNLHLIDGVGRRFACFRKYVGFTELETTYEYFISEAKEANWRTGVSARANMQIFEDECLNLTYLNSVFLRYAITNKKVDSWYIGGRKVDYAYAIRYLNKALEYLDKREEEEKAMLEPYMELKDGWQVELSRWRKEHGYHTLTPTRAKTFAKENK